MTKSTESPRQITMQAPVLFIPNVLNVDFCKHLIHLWETEGNQDSGVMVDVNGKLTEVLEYEQTIRRNHFLKEGETQERLTHFIRNRVRPEIQKAFHFKITRFEGFTVSCYDASVGGYFRPHRDNDKEGNAYRRFAMTINLNVGEYEGGYLRFPEYGSDLYQPETGSAVIFSCSLLHEATDVTKGRRFALVSFFYSEQEVPLIEEYNCRVRNLQNQFQGEYQLQTQQ
jgi:predicted 2-oxoglutarate/Fe(II)-dependent dioxygenase YbiX